jgi:predicted nicotinamide N-methyase
MMRCPATPPPSSPPTCTRTRSLRARARAAPADDPIGLWELGEGEYRSEQPPPFWAFAWAGGQALARYVLEHPDLVAGRRVLDLAAGSGLVAIAAAKAGAASVRAVDIDPLAMAAIELNAATNGVTVTAELADILDAGRADADVVLAGDVFYSAAMAARVYAFLRRAVRDGARALVGDPDRAFLPRDQLGYWPLWTFRCRTRWRAPREADLDLGGAAAGRPFRSLTRCAD